VDPRHCSSFETLCHDWVNLQERRDKNVRPLEGDLLRQAESLLTSTDRDRVGSHLKRDTCNLLDVLGCAHREDSYTDTLAWLMKPWESHGLGNALLEHIVRTAYGRSLPNTRIESVRTQRSGSGGRVDLEIVGDGWWFILENKLDAPESPCQTLDYTKWYGTYGKFGADVFLVFLTPKGKKPNDGESRFKPLSYRQLRRILEKLKPEAEPEQTILRHFVRRISSKWEKT
jgi:PD-(D/E)XK nuclease superfamily